MRPRATKCVIHFNKFRVKNGLPWTVHNRGVCHAASHVEILVPMFSEERPHLKTNPRYFFTCRGFVHLLPNNVVRITNSPKGD